MTKVQRDSTQNMARRYRHLFTLPSLKAAALLSSIPVLALVAVSRYVLHTDPIFTVLYFAIAEILLFASIEIDALALRTRIATFRRLGAISIFGNSMWLIVSLIGLALYYATGSQERFLSLLILGAFFAVAFRAFVFGSLFYGAPWRGLPLSLVQPVMIFLPAAFGGFASLGTYQIALASICGIIAVASTLTYASKINGTSAVAGFRPLELVQAFLDAWVIEDATDLEKLLDPLAKEHSVRSEILELSSGKTTAELIVPGIHPGPFYPVGSSNLPADIFSMLKGVELVPLTVHSISDHDLNLPSKGQVKQYVASLDANRELIDSGATITSPVSRTVNKATVSGFALGSTALLAITQAPYGMEDFPIEVRDAVADYSSARGFRETLVIDAHNSEGAKPDSKEASDAIKASKEVIDALKSIDQHGFRFGVAHSGDLGERKIVENDVGPAGAGLLLFEDKESKAMFSLLVADANNALPGFRERVIERFERETGSKLFELCTSDTHVTAAKTISSKGYLALGEKISSEKFASAAVALCKKAKSSLDDGSFKSSLARSSVKTIGGELLDQFSGLMDSTISVAKRGAIALTILAFLLIALVAAF